MPAARTRSLNPPLAATLARARRRDIAEAIVRRADALPAQDRDLLLAVYADGRTALDLARHDDPAPDTLHLRAATLRRRIRRLARRVLQPAFEVVRTRAHTWPPTMARVGHVYFILGVPMRQASLQLHISTHRIRTYLEVIRALAASPALAPTLNLDREVAA